MRTHAWLSWLALLSFACEGASSDKPAPQSAGSAGVTGAAGSPASGGRSVGGAGGESAVGGAAGSATSGAGSGGASGVSGASGGAGRGAAGSSGAAGSAGTAGSGGTGAGAAGMGAGAGTSDSGGTSGAAGADSGPIGVLVFSKTEGYPHISIPDGNAALMGLAEASNWIVTLSDDASIFTDGGLAGFDVLVFLSPTGDILNTEQEAAFQRFFQGGNKGFVGIHAASDTEFDWAYYGEFVGAFFREHPQDIQPATIVVEDTTHVTTQGLPASWMRTDEWYAFRENPRPNVHVLMSLDETSYDPGTSAMGDHPIAWWHEYQGARVFYTALGHTSESYADPLFMTHVARAIDWAAGR